MKVATLKFKESILQRCKMWKDVEGRILEKCLSKIFDLVAVEARYHNDCRKKFFTSLSSHSSPGRPVSDKVGEAINL